MKRSYSFLKLFIKFIIILLFLNCGNIVFSQTNNDFKYKKSKDSITITGYKGTNHDVQIPKTINNIPVKSIDDRAFMDNEIIRNIYIPNTVEKIGAFAFSGCVFLNYVYLIDSTHESRLTIFDKDSFYKSSNSDIIISLSGTKKTELVFNKNKHKIQWLSVEEYVSRTSSRGSLDTSYYISYNDKILSIPYAYKNEIKIEETQNNILFFLRAPRGRVYSGYKDNLVYYNDSFLLSDNGDIDIIYNNNIDIFFSIGSKNNKTLYKNNQIIITGEFDNIKISKTGDLYYTMEQNNLVSIYKNGSQLFKDIQNLKSFDIDDKGENLVYTTLEKNGTMKLFKNNLLYAQTNDMFFYPTLSPDGNKLYYFEVKQGSNNSLLFYIKGTNVPSPISGPYLKPYGYGTFIFSNDSNYVACHIESFTKGMEGEYIFLNGKLLGPYKSVSNNFYFTNDSKTFIFTRNGIEEKINLK